MTLAPTRSTGLTLLLALLCLALLGLALLGLALHPVGPNPSQPLLRWLLSALGVGAGYAALCVWRGAAGFGLLGLMLLGGSAAQLYLTDPLWFPALRFALHGKADLAMLALLALEAAAAGLVLARRGPARLATAAARAFGSVRLLAVLAISFALSVSVMGYAVQGAWGSWIKHLVAASALIALHLAMLLAIAQTSRPRPLSRPVPPLLLAAVAAGASLLLAWFGFERMPHVEDELAYLFQARTFAQGSLGLPAPPAAALPGLDYYLLQVQNGHWFAVTPPGWPAVLALGVLVGAPWLVNPLLFGLAILLAHAITADRLGRTAADRAALVLATSPWLIAAAASMMTHTLTLALILTAWWAVVRAERSPRRALLWALAAGLAMGWVFTIRQLDGLLIGILTGLWLLTLVRPEMTHSEMARPAAVGRNIRLALAYGLGCLATGSAYFLYNFALTGHPTQAPMALYLNALWGPGANAYGFGPGIGPAGGWGALDLAPGHSPLEGLINTANNLAALQLEASGWAIGSLGLALACLFWQRLQRFDIAMLVVLLATIAALFFYWFAGSFYIGPRYWFIAAFPLAVLCVRGLAAIEARLPPEGAAKLPALFTLLCLSGLLIFTPWRGVAKYHDYQDYHATIRTAAETGRFGTAIVLVAPVGNIASALMLNDPALPADQPIFLADLPSLDLAGLAAAYPGRAIVHFAPDWAPARP